MPEPQVIPASISIDEQGRVVIINPQLAEAMRGLAAAAISQSVAAENRVVQCGCNTVAGCG